MAALAALRQVPDAPGTPSRPQHAPHIAARHHLQQYLASIERSSFVDDLAAGIWAGNRLAISRSLTLCESTRPDHALQAAALLRKLIDNRQQQQQSGQAGAHGSSSSSSSSPYAGQQDTLSGEVLDSRPQDCIARGLLCHSFLIPAECNATPIALLC
jgi:hypothetical protein